MCHLGYSSFKGKEVARLNLMVLSHIRRQHIGKWSVRAKEGEGILGRSISRGSRVQWESK